MLNKVNGGVKFVWRLVHRFFLRRKNVYIHSSVLFNNNTKFGGYNKIHSGTCVGNSLIGEYTYIGIRCNLSNAKIGKFCSIGAKVEIISADHPSSGFVSTSPTFFSTLKQNGVSFVDECVFKEHLTIEGYNAIIGNDVWIGNNVIIKGGTRIGDGAIVAMGAVVTKDVPPYAIVAGVPAKIIRYRFEEVQIHSLLKIQWWNMDVEWLKRNTPYFTDINLFLSKCQK